MLLHLKTWPEVEAYLRQSPGILLPVGSTEQHGPNGLIGTDALCAEAVARGVGAATGALVAPTVAVGMAQHHLAFPGTLSLRPSTLLAVVRDMVQSLARHGFRRVFVVNGHGGNIATLAAAFAEIHAEASLRPAGGNAPELRCRLRNWWDAAEVRRLSAELFGAAEGSHATPSEVSVTWHLHPEAARPMEFDPPVAPSGGFADAEDYRRRYPDGRIGSNPGLASAEAGARLLAAAVEGLAADYRAFLAEA